MMTYNRILIAIDDSNTSIRAAKHGLKLSSKLGASCAIVFVIDTAVISEDVFAEEISLDQLTKLKKKANDTLNLIATKFPEYTFERFMPEGKPSQGIIKIAEDWEADLIVMGTMGKSGLKRIFMGSTAENTLRHSSVPILVVPPPS
jgi:nucleotide-binding universal stress UspA family protein